MKYVSAILILMGLVGITFTACQAAPDLTKIKNGMTSAQVVSAVGQPTQKQALPFGAGEAWQYNQNQMVVFNQGKVVNVVLDIEKNNREIAKAMQELNKLGK